MHLFVGVQTHSPHKYCPSIYVYGHYIVPYSSLTNTFFVCPSSFIQLEVHYPSMTGGGVETTGNICKGILRWCWLLPVLAFNCFFRGWFGWTERQRHIHTMWCIQSHIHRWCLKLISSIQRSCIRGALLFVGTCNKLISAHFMSLRWMHFSFSLTWAPV